MFVFKFVWNVFGDKQTLQISAIPVARQKVRTLEKRYKDDLKNISGSLELLHYCKDEAKNRHGDSPEVQRWFTILYQPYPCWVRTKPIS